MKKLMMICTLCCCMFLLNSCVKERLRGEGAIATDVRNVGTFANVEMNGSHDVVVTYGNECKVTVSDYGNLLPYVETSVKGTTLTIQYKDNTWVQNGRMKVYVQMPDVQGLTINGSGEVKSVGSIKSTGMEICINGSGNVKLAGDSMPNVEANINGSGKIDVVEGPTQMANVKINGSGDVYVNAWQALHADIAGSGTVYYKGAASVSSNISGSGSIKKL